MVIILSILMQKLRFYAVPNSKDMAGELKLALRTLLVLLLLRVIVVIFLGGIGVLLATPSTELRAESSPSVILCYSEKPGIYSLSDLVICHVFVGPLPRVRPRIGNLGVCCCWCSGDR